MSKLVSIAGADDETSLDALSQLVCDKSVEIALLYYPEKEGYPRNPSKQWREQFFNKISRDQRAIHLCGVEVFNEILSPEFKSFSIYSELKKYHRVQLNINARRADFSEEQVLAVFETLTQEGFSLIFQCHEESVHVIEKFVRSRVAHRHQFAVLLDSSKGKGIFSGNWEIPPFVYELKLPLGIAGGLNADNIQHVKASISYSKVWFDLESGARTNNVFDLVKVQNIMTALELIEES